MSSSPDFKNSFGDEPAVLEEDDPSRATIHPPSSPSFARRVSFGAQALRDVRLGGSPGAAGGGRRPSSSLFTLNENFENAIPSRRATSGTAKTAGKSRGLSLSYRPNPKIAKRSHLSPNLTDVQQEKASIGPKPYVIDRNVPHPSPRAIPLAKGRLVLAPQASPIPNRQKKSQSPSSRRLPG
ncbi:uncharacterized protein A1O5_11923 [Cladophialophora psammophila CBS 110553]|uniref:Uncharacterized protein n=1 Tax=Cladophialophora psammophila CBS 110553 TaxID=1182543 RepID=W9W8R1_9EURO|nr:uncharacterized protein A1O5_11923 [Cladophialophora psammophila CBS 110553]EXJ61365.1 hypothetical protein A1O5_11923 [Cladophialophora psammophila CBS 110553]